MKRKLDVEHSEAYSYLRGPRASTCRQRALQIALRSASPSTTSKPRRTSFLEPTTREIVRAQFRLIFTSPNVCALFSHNYRSPCAMAPKPDPISSNLVTYLVWRYLQEAGQYALLIFHIPSVIASTLLIAY
jgi:hypothetical protein